MEPTTSGTVQQAFSSKRIRLFRFLLSLASLLISLLVAEGVLRLIEKIQMGDRAIANKLIEDPVLGFKLEAYTQGHSFRDDLNL